MTDQDRGVVFPVSADGRRSTAAVGRAVVADALRPVDPVGAQQAERETSWRAGYPSHFRRLVEAGLSSPESAVGVAAAGLGSARDRLEVADAPGATLEEWAGSEPAERLETVELRGHGHAERELSLPLHGRRLRGAELHDQLDTWVGDGVMEPTAAEAVRTVMANPDWLRLEGRTVVVLGAGAEMGPLQALLRWGADVAAVDLALPHVWERVAAAVSEGAGTARVPGRPGGGAWQRRAGVDLIAEVPRVGSWLETVPGSLVLGNYVYADGATNVRVSAAVDALTTRLLGSRPDTALAFLATPTDVFAVPGDAVEHSTRCYEGRSAAAKLVARPLRAVSGGRLLHRAYAPGADPGLNDSLVPQQGPNYALAKRLQRWRATVARHEGATVSLNVAPPTRTRSVVKNRALAAAYAGAHRFGVEVFEPATSNVLMAALLVHDLHTRGGPPHPHPWQDEAHGAVHGGLWRTAYAPRSALGLAALLGYGAARA
ncbi:MAG TPA: hypothetical protein VFG72_09110 [Marmoricola sp.]|nr:hypothetical protein [Marmoricola sp.]